MGSSYSTTKSSLIMKVMGFYLTLAVCLLTSNVMSAPAPLFFPVDPITTVGITAGAVTPIPTLAILAGKALVLKGALAGAALVGALSNQRSSEPEPTYRGRRH